MTASRSARSPVPRSHAVGLALVGALRAGHRTHGRTGLSASRARHDEEGRARANLQGRPAQMQSDRSKGRTGLTTADREGWQRVSRHGGATRHRRTLRCLPLLARRRLAPPDTGGKRRSPLQPTCRGLPPSPPLIAATRIQFPRFSRALYRQAHGTDRREGLIGQGSGALGDGNPCPEAVAL
jgi:hypothetical protein